MKSTAKKNPENQVKRYLETYNGKELLQKHRLCEYGTWKILGEDPNCDMGGVHKQEDLGTIEGTLEDVILTAVQMKGFWSWGGGGDIRKVKVEQAVPADPYSLDAIKIPTVSDLREKLKKDNAKRDEEVKKVVAKELAKFAEWLGDKANYKEGIYVMVIDDTDAIFNIGRVVALLDLRLQGGGYTVKQYSSKEIHIQWNLEA